MQDSPDKVKVDISIRLSPKLAVQMANEIIFLDASAYPALAEFFEAIVKELEVCSDLGSIISKEVSKHGKTIGDNSESLAQEEIAQTRPDSTRGKVDKTSHEWLTAGDKNFEDTSTGNFQKEDRNNNDSGNFVSRSQPSTNRDTGNVLGGGTAIDVMELLGNIIVKVRCKNCRTLNPKDARQCRECRCTFYKSEEEYQEALSHIAKIEKGEQVCLTDFKSQCDGVYDKVQIRIEKNVEMGDMKEENAAEVRRLRLRPWKKLRDY